MSLPPHLPNGAVPQVAPELASGRTEATKAAAAPDEELEMDKAIQIRQLRERRVMETKQELNRIEQMGKVHQLLHQHIAAKIGRNLEAKFLNYGPLGKGRDTDLTSPLNSPKQIPPPPPIRIQTDSSSRKDDSSSSSRGASSRRRMKRSMKDWIVGRKNLGELSSSFEDSQKKELEDIKGMQIVQSHLANRRRARSLANRMFNARVNNRRTKTSILLTGSEPDQQEMVEAMRHMNRFVIEKFLQTQSQNRRVLDRLNSIQMKAISDIQVGKAETRKGEPVRHRSDSSIHEAMIVEEAEEREKEEERKGVKPPHKRASFSSLSNLLERTGGTLKAKVEHGVKKLTHHSSPKRHLWKASSPREATSNRKKQKGSRRLRWNRAEREKMRSYADEDEIFSKSSSTDEVDAASSPVFSGGGMTLEPLMERAVFDTPATVKDQESAESDKTISPVSSSGGAFQPYSSGPPPPPSLPGPPSEFALRSSHGDHGTLTDQAAPISIASVAPPTSSATPLKGQAMPTKHVPPPASPQSGPVQAPPTLTSPATPPSPQEHHHHHRAKQAPPTLKSALPPAPPPFQAHGLPTTLNTSAMSSSTTQPGNILTDSPSTSMEAEFGAGTPAGYQADTEFQFEDLSESQEKPRAFAGSIFKPLRGQLHAQLSTVSSGEESMHETPTKRTRIEEESDNDGNDDKESAEFDDFQAPLSPVLQPHVVKGSAEMHMGGAEEHWSQGGRRGEGKIIPMLVDMDGPVQVAEEVVLKDKGGRKNIRPVKSSRYYDMDGTSERDEIGDRERRPVMSTHRVVPDQASVDSQEETKDEDERMGEIVKEKGTSSNYPEPPKRNLSSRKSSSLELQPGGSSDTSTQAPPSRVKRHFSTPTVSMDIENRPQIRPSFKPKASANRAYYTPIEIDEEFNPFNYEFEQDPAEVVPKPKSGGSSTASSGSGRIETDSASVPLRQRSPRAKPHRYDSSPRSPRMSPGKPQCRTAELKRKTIPPSAYDDPGFRQYLKTLSHPPTYDDYLSFRVVRRLVVIGDDIEVRYKDKINNALDNIYMDIVKKTFSFENFSKIANRLLLESKRMQDRVFMIPLLARRLKEEAKPQVASTVGKYTEMFMDNFVTKYLMSMGGWETIVESYEDIEVHDEHPANYLVEGGANSFGNGEDLVYHLPEGGASNYDHLYDGGTGAHVPFDNHVHPPPFQDHGFNMNEIHRQPYLDPYEEKWPLPEEEEEEEAPLTKEEIFLSYLALHHPFLAEEPDYLRRVNSVEVLFQEKSDPSDDAPDNISYNNDIDGNSTHTMPRRRKRSSQISLARSLSVDSLASPGLGSGAFCASPTASTTFLSRRISRSASRNPAPPAESPTKRAPPPSHPPPHPHPHPHPPIMEQVDYPIVQNPLQSGSTNNIISTSISKGTQARPPPISILVPNPATSTSTANPPIQYPVSLSPSSSVHVPSSQVSVSTSPSSVGPYYQVQSSGENYEHLYDSDPSRSNSANSDTGSNVSKPNSGKSKGVQHQMKTNGKDKERQPETHVGPPKWVVPVAIVTVGVALLAGYFYMKRQS